jgi:hypothetical protein
MDPYIIDPSVDTVLNYCGFSEMHRRQIAQDGFDTFEDIAKLESKDITSLADGFASRTVANGKITFGLRRTNLVKASVHWIQDFGRISREPSLDGIHNAEEFLQVTDASRMRARMRKQYQDESEKSTVTSPGKLKNMRDWPVWDGNLNNHLSTILGHNGVPLSYLLREHDAPDYREEGVLDFESLCILCTPMFGIGYKQDARKLHQLLHGFVQGETAETWIKAFLRKQDGRVDYKGLLGHFGGEGNKSILIKEAENLRKNLFYKNERGMKLETFLTSMELMFESFAKHEEVLTEAQKIRLLFDKIQHPLLEGMKNSLQIAYNLSTDDSVSYTFIVNSFSAEVAGLPDFAPAQRSVSGVGRSDKSFDKSPANGIRGDDGSIFTGYYKNFKSLSSEDKTAIFEEQLRLNIAPKKKNNQGARRNNSKVVQGKKTISKLQKQISSLKTRFNKAEKQRGNDETEDGADEEIADNAGDQFGGRQGKKAKKQG